MYEEREMQYFISVALVGEKDDNTEGKSCADSFEPDILKAERETGFCFDFSCLFPCKNDHSCI